MQYEAMQYYKIIKNKFQMEYNNYNNHKYLTRPYWYADFLAWNLKVISKYM